MAAALGERMKKYPYEGLVVTVGTLAVIVPLALWLVHGSKTWSFPTFAVVCISIMAACLLIARIVDKRDADRLKRETEQSPWPVLDLPKSDYRSQSSPEKPE